MSPGGTFPVDNTKINGFTRCPVGIGGFGDIDGFGGFGGIDGHKKATATLHRRGRLFSQKFSCCPATPLPAVWLRIGA